MCRRGEKRLPAPWRVRDPSSHRWSARVTCHTLGAAMAIRLRLGSAGQLGGVQRVPLSSNKCGTPRGVLPLSAGIIRSPPMGRTSGRGVVGMRPAPAGTGDSPSELSASEAAAGLCQLTLPHSGAPFKKADISDRGGGGRPATSEDAGGLVASWRPHGQWRVPADQQAKISSPTSNPTGTP